MLKLRTITIMLVCVLSVALLAETTFAQGKKVSREDVVKRMKNSQTYFTETLSDPDTAIPKSVLKKASGFVVLRQLKVGFIVGAMGGGGFAMVKDEESGAWSPPAFVETGAASFGLQIGAQEANAIYVVMSPESMKKLLKGGLKIGADVSAQVGPVGKDITVDLEKSPEIFVYSKNKGLYGGATFKASSFLPDKVANEAFYGKKMSAEDILFNRAVEMPEEAGSFVEFLTSY